MRFTALAIGLILTLTACGSGSGSPTPSPTVTPSPQAAPTQVSANAWKEVPALRDAVLGCSERPYHIIANWEESQADWIPPGRDEDSEDFINRVTAMNAATAALEGNFRAIADWLAANYPGSARDLFEGFIDPDWSPLMYDCVAQALY